MWIFRFSLCTSDSQAFFSQVKFFLKYAAINNQVAVNDQTKNKI